jgi:hypothetical protein
MENQLNDYKENYITGYVSLFRSFINWEWFTEPNMVTVFIYCLLKANFKDNRWKGIEIKKGSFITSYSTISKDTGLSLQNVRTCIKKLVLTKELTSEPTNKHTLLTVVKYSVYQQKNIEANTPPNNQLTNDQQTTNNQLTTTNNDNNINKENNIKDGEEKKSFDDVFLSVESCKEKYLSNEKIIKAVCSNSKNNISENEIEERLNKFNTTLTEKGDYSKTFKDYCSHFLSWHKKNKILNNSFNPKSLKGKFL